jgi:hypothetical protein
MKRLGRFPIPVSLPRMGFISTVGVLVYPFLFPIRFGKGGAALDSISPRCGLSKAASQNPITRVHQSLIGSFVADPQSGLIHDVQFNTICRITSDFIASQLLGMSLYTDLDEMISRIQNRYFGDSRRAITVILRDAAAKLRECQARPV